MQNKKSSVNWMAIGQDLINCLCSNGNHRLSRYDAFVWLMERINKGISIHNEHGEQVGALPFSSSYKRLAEEWNWERHSVCKFIEELVSISVISSQRKGNTFVFSLSEKSHKHLLL